MFTLKKTLMISDRMKSIDVFEILSIKSRWIGNIKTEKQWVLP